MASKSNPLHVERLLVVKSRIAVLHSGLDLCTVTYNADGDKIPRLLKLLLQSDLKIRGEYLRVYCHGDAPA